MPSLPSEYTCSCFLFNIVTKLHYEVLHWVFLSTQNIHQLGPENLNITQVHHNNIFYIVDNLYFTLRLYFRNKQGLEDFHNVPMHPCFIPDYFSSLWKNNC